MLRKLQYYIKMSLVSIWFVLVTIVFYFISWPAYGKTWLSTAYARFLNWGSHAALGMYVRVEGRPNLKHKPAVIIVNHQSNFDSFLQGTVFPVNTIIIGKKAMGDLPIYGHIYKASNNIIIDRTDRKDSIAGLEVATKRLHYDKCYIWIFPEGTRSKGSGLGRFKKGAFHMAINAGVPLIPVVTEMLGDKLDTQRKIAKGGILDIRILEPISTEGKTKDDVNDLVELAEDLFAKNLAEMSGIAPSEVWKEGQIPDRYLPAPEEAA